MCFFNSNFFIDFFCYLLYSFFLWFCSDFFEKLCEILKNSTRQIIDWNLLALLFLKCVELSLIVFATAKQYITKSRKTFIFLLLMNSSATIDWSLLLVSISAIRSLSAVNVLCFLCRLYLSIFSEISPISFKYYTKTLELLQCLKPTLAFVNY